MSQFEVLFQKFISQTITPEEREWLFEMIRQDSFDPTLLSLIEQVIDQAEADRELPAQKADQILSLILPQKPRRSLLKRLAPAVRYAAAAVLVLLAASLAYIAYPDHSPGEDGPAPQAVNEILPAKTGALLTLSDGSTLVLDSIQDGVIAQQRGTTVTLKDNQLAYDDRHAEEVTYNTLSTPRGRLFYVVLPDSSKVWLNTESSLKFPTRFSGKERVVELSGEAWFDIVRNEKMPFRVKVDGRSEVEVLGTSFNINSYQNEGAVRTTLLRGKVRVSAPAGDGRRLTTVLQPGQQAEVRHTELKVQAADTALVMAWKNGIFNFENAGVREVMQQLERWYDIEVAYPEGVPDLVFGGKMGRDLTLQQVLRILEISNVHYRIEGRTLTILRK